MLNAYLNIAALLGGAAALSFAFDWKVGVGVALIAYWLKTPE